MAQGKKEEAEETKKLVTEKSARLAELEAKESELSEKVTKIMMTIPNIIDPTVPIGKDDSENVEVEKYGEPVVPDFEIPYHTDIMQAFAGIDKEAAGRVAGEGANLKYAFGTYHLHYKLEQTPLHVPRCHLWRQYLYVRGAEQVVEVLSLGAAMVGNVLVKRCGNAHRSCVIGFFAFTPRRYKFLPTRQKGCTLLSSFCFYVALFL